MSVYHESVSSRKLFGKLDRLLVCSLNWIGDCVMAMPALQTLKREFPDLRVVMLAKPAVAPLWSMHAAVAETVTLANGLTGARRAARAIRAAYFRSALVLPHSFRSALVPFLAGVPARLGGPGHWRDWMLTDVVRPAADHLAAHQRLEYFRLMGLDEDPRALPELNVPERPAAEIAGRLRIDAGAAPLVALLPGAARGPAKRWPPKHFIELGRRLVTERRCRLLVMGSEAEKALGRVVADGVGDRALNLAGAAELRDSVALLSLCRLVVANDSGGMHLAAAAGVPVVAIYGMTDPGRTGPLGHGHRILRAENVTGSPDIEPDSAEARRALASITPERAYRAAVEVLDETAATG